MLESDDFQGSFWEQKQGRPGQVRGACPAADWGLRGWRTEEGVGGVLSGGARGCEAKRVPSPAGVPIGDQGSLGSTREGWGAASGLRDGRGWGRAGGSLWACRGPAGRVPSRQGSISRQWMILKSLHSLLEICLNDSKQ